MSIITISREFGSGGREVGKRLADAFGYAYYDREIVSAIAQKHQMDEGYVAQALEGGMFRSLPVHFGRTFSYTSMIMPNTTNLFVEQNKILKEVAAKGNCVIVGRAASTILQDYDPFRLFVYADMPSKIRRCQQRMTRGETMAEREMERKIKRIDGERARYYELFSDLAWGDKAGYDLCVNTTGAAIKALVPAIEQYIRANKGIEK